MEGFKRPQGGQVCSYKDKLYMVEKILKSKNQETREWEDSVMYLSLERKESYVREIKDFCDKFEVVLGKIEWTIK